MKRRFNNKGYSLVELLLTIAILGLVMLGVAMIMRTTSVSYKDGANEVTMQTEAQIVANQIEEIFMDGTGNYRNSYIDGNEFFGITSAGATHFIIYKSTDQEIWYQKCGTTATAPNAEAEGKWALMAENVSGIDISGYSDDPSSANCDNMVTVKVNMDRAGYTYTATKDIYFRNAIENVSVSQIQNNGPSTSDPTQQFTDVYVDRYYVLDLEKEFELDLSKGVTITGLSENTYKLVVPNYAAAGNKDTVSAITGFSEIDKTQYPTTTDQIAYCQSLSEPRMALVTTDTINNNPIGTVTNSNGVTIVGKTSTNSDVRVRLLTKAVSFKLETATGGPDGVIHVVQATQSLPKYNWIYVEGLDYRSMVQVYNKEFRYTMVAYNDSGDNSYSSGEKLSGNDALGLYTVGKTSLNFDYTQGPSGLKQISNGPKMQIGLAPDPESGDILVVNKEPATEADVATYNTGNIRVAFLIEVPYSTGNKYELVDLVVMAQGTNCSFANYDGGYARVASADALGVNPFTTN